MFLVLCPKSCFNCNIPHCPENCNGNGDCDNSTGVCNCFRGVIIYFISLNI